MVHILKYEHLMSQSLKIIRGIAFILLIVASGLQAAVTFGSSSTAVLSTDSTSITINQPESTVEGDLLMAVIATDKNNAISPPVGWTEIRQQSNGATIGVWWKIASSSEPATYTFMWSNSEQAVGGILRYSGADPNDPINVSEFDNARSNQPTAPEDSTTADDVLILRLFGADNDALPSPDSLTYPSGSEGRFALVSNSGTGSVTGAVADHLQSVPGLTGEAVFTLTSDQKWIAGTIAIKPPPLVGFTNPTPSGSESQNAALEVTLSDPSGVDVTVDYEVTGGTATGNGTDYTLLGTGMLTFLPGSVSETIDLAIVDDARKENNETIEVRLRSSVNANLTADTVHTYTIIDNDPYPTIQFSDTTSSGNEGITLANLQLVLSAASDFNALVAYAPTGGTASGDGEDYTLATDTLLIAAGATIANIPILIANDILDEDNETVIVTISEVADGNASIGGKDHHIYTISDNDPSPAIQFSLASSSGSEESSPVNLQLELSAASGRDVSVSYAVTGGTATGGDVDYTLEAGVATITAGQTTANISLTITDDALDEANETIVVSLSSPNNASLGANQSHTYTINDDDTPPSVQFFSQSSENDEAITPANLQVVLSDTSGLNVTVNYSVTGGTANGSGEDYTLTAGTATISAGTKTTNIPVAIVNDAIDELNETIQVSLSDPTNATLGVNTVHTYTIIDNDTLPTVQFTLANSAGDEGSSPANLQLVLSSISGRDVTVDYEVTGGTAIGSGVDYTLTSSTATISAGATTTNIPITIINDNLDESNETVVVWISGADNADVSTTNHTHTYTINDNDLPPAVLFAQPASSGAESSSPADLELVLEDTSGFPVTVDYVVTGGTATGGEDYTLAADSVTIQAGETSAYIHITIDNDNLYEADETIQVTISNPRNATLGAYSIHTYTISNDDDPPLIQFTKTNSDSSESITSIDLEIKILSVSGLDASVNYTVTAGGSATGGGEDYTLGAGTATVSASALNTVIPVIIINDDLDELNETIEVVISNPVNADLGTFTSHTYTIIDDDDPPTVQFTYETSSGDEGIPTANIQVELSALSGRDVSVNYAVTDGTATSGVDYSLPSGTATITAGNLTTSIPIIVFEDEIDEDNETVVISLSGQVNATLGSPNVHTYTIGDNETMPIVQFASDSSSGGENLTQINLQVKLSFATDDDVSVSYTITGGSASGGGVDYTINGDTATIPAGATSVYIPIAIINDNLDEDNETIQVTISNPLNASLGASQTHTYTIVDDDDPPTVQFAATSSSGDESIITANLLVQLSTASGREVTVDYAVSGGTASGSGVDYTLAPGTATINPGATSINIPITIANDALNEDDESIIVSLSNQVNAILGTQRTHTYTILNNDPLPSVQFTFASSSGSEVNTAVNLQLKLSAASGRDVTVDYYVSGGTASGEGVDFNLAAGTATVTAGATTASIPVTIVDDSRFEVNETIVVTLTSPEYATLGVNYAHTYTIYDNDSPPSVQFAQASSSGDEGFSPANLQLKLSAVSGQDVTVEYHVTGGTASGGGVDYTLADGTKTIPAGDTLAVIPLTIMDDLLDELDETVQVSISNPVNAGLDSNQVHTFTIEDNDFPPIVEFAEAISSGDEGDTPAAIEVVLSTESGLEVTVGYSITGGTATDSGIDYILLGSGTLSFSPGTVSKTISLSIIDDAVYEGNETIELTLSENPINATLETWGINVHTYSIIENDEPPTVQFVSTSSSGDEFIPSVNLQLQLSGITPFDVSVDYNVTGGSATGDSVDYKLVTGTAIVDSGTTTGVIHITIVDDNLYEADETIEVTIFNPIYAVLGANKVHTYTISDNDVIPVISFESVDGSGSESLTPAALRFELSNISGLAASVDYTVNGGTATGTGVDFTLTAGTATIPVGGTSDSVLFNIVNDLNDEYDETIQVTLSNPVNATLGSITAYTYTINDDDDPPTIQFATSASSGYEDTTAYLQIGLSNASGLDVSVYYQVTGGTVLGSSTDYILPAGTATISAGELTTNIEMIVIDDNIGEFAEDVEVTISNPVNATLGSRTVHTYTILDNEPIPVLDFPITSVELDEANADSSVYITMSGPWDLDVKISYDMRELTATAHGYDFTLCDSIKATIYAGDISTVLPIDIHEDALYEEDEQFEVILTGATYVNLGPDIMFTYTIMDNDLPPTVEFNTVSSSGPESANASIQMELSAVSGRETQVSYSIAGNATAADYATPSGTATIPAGQTAADIGITIVNDALDEQNETIELTLTDAVNATLGAGTVHTYTINDDDNPPVVEVVAINNAHEGDTLGHIPVILSTPSGRVVTVDYSVTGGTAADTDYVSLEGTLTIPAGSWGEDIVFEIVDDTTYEADETIIVTLANAINANLSGDNYIHNFTINDDDAPTQVQFALSSSSVAENTPTVLLQVELQAVSGDTVNVNYQALDGTATNEEDFILVSGTAKIPTDSLQTNISISIIPDTIFEGDETFTVRLYSPSGANLGENTSHTVTILEDDSPPLLTFQSPSSGASESTTDLTFDVILSTQADLDVSFEYAVTGGTATSNGVDFTLAAGSKTIVAGLDATTITASVEPDNLYESDEDFVISLFNVINASLGSYSTHTYTISDDDSKPTIQFSGTTGGASEQTGNVNLVLTLSEESGLDAEVDYSLNGPALGDSVDYKLASGPITIPAGQSTANLALEIIDDDLYELSEDIILTLLAEPTNASLGNNQTYTYTITDNDPMSTVAFSTVSSSDSESVTIANLEVSLTQPAGLDVSVNYTVTGGTATGAGDYADYALSSGTATITAGQSAVMIPVTIYDDPWDELDEETIIVTISSPVNATLGAQNVHTYTIHDNDETPTISFVSAESAAVESASVDTIKLSLSAPSRLPVSAQYIVSGSATGSGVDYSIGPSRTAEFAPGNTVVQIKATIIDDLFAEPDETIIVTIDTDGLTNCVLGTNSVYTHTIQNNDNPPPVFQLGAIATTGGLVVPGYWNSTNTSLNVKVPVGNTLSLENGSIQLQARIGLAEYEDVGDSVKIILSDIDTVKNVFLSAVDFEGISGFADGAEVTVRAIISDVVGNSTASEEGSSVIIVDQTAPAAFILGDVITLGAISVSGYWNASNTGLAASAPLLSEDTSLLGGQVQLQAAANGTFGNLGAAAQVQSPDLTAGVISISVADSEGVSTGVEELTGFSENARLAFRAMMRDVAGNARTGIPSNRQLLVDQITPQATLTYSQTLAKQGDVVMITATFNEEFALAPTIHVKYPGESDSISEDMIATGVPSVWTYNAEIPEGNDGEVTVDIGATDQAGNDLDTVNAIGYLVIDNTAPSYSLAYDNSVARQGTEVLITATFGDTIRPDPTISIDFPATGYNILNRTMDPTRDELVWTYNFTTPYTPDGEAVVTIMATDLAGNPADPLPGMASLRIDNTSPVITITTPEPDAFIRQAALTYELNENIKDGHVTWIWEINSDVQDPAFQHDYSLTLDELTASTHTWSLANPPPLVHGASYMARVSASDSAGNMGSAQVSGLIYDEQAPDTGSVYVYDGPGMDIDTTRSTDSLSAHYGGFDEPLSGITLYEYAVGTTPGGCDVVDWTGNGTDTTISVYGLELSYKVVYYISIRATDGAGNVSEPVPSDGVAVMDLPHLATSIVQNSLVSAHAQVFVVDSLGMVDSVHVLVDEQKLELTEIGTYAYVANHKFSSVGSHSLSATGFSDLGDTTVTYSFGLALAKSNQSWIATSPEGQFKVIGASGAVSQDLYLLVVDSTLMVPDVHKGGAYRLGDGQYVFEKPVKVSMFATQSNTDDSEPQAVYILRSDGHWQELPSVDDAQYITAWTESAGIFRLGPRTIIVPQATSLHQNYPNPFNPTTRIVFDIGFSDGPDQRASVVIYNLLGQHVRTLYDDQAWIGSHELVWSGLDQRGLAVASGVYFVRLTTDTGYRATIKMLLVR